jgi:hypothetical protein
MKLTLRYAILIVAVLACSDSGVEPWDGPNQIGALRMTASIGESPLRLGDTTSIVFRVHNNGADAVTLEFNTCQGISAHITNPSGDVFYLGGPNTGCRTPAYTMVIPPGGAIAAAVLIRGGTFAEADGPMSGKALPAGEYRAFARLVYPGLDMVTPVVPFVISGNR